MTTETEIEVDINAEALEKTGWLILDAAEYKREIDGKDHAPAAQRMRREVRKRILARARKLDKSGDPLQLADTIADLVRGFGK